MSTAPVLRLRRAGQPLGDAIDHFLDERDIASTTRRVYGVVLRTMATDLGEDTDVADVTNRRLASHVRRHHEDAAAMSWNRVVATIGSFFAYCERQEWLTTPSPAQGLERRRVRMSRETAERTKAISSSELVGFLDGLHPLREKTLWWLLYETAARANEVLGLDVGDLDLPNRRATIIGKGGNAETVGWETKTARLLPRLLAGRRSGPLFLASLSPIPARHPPSIDICPETGRARLSYRRAAQLFTDASPGWTLHQLRHSRLTHLAEAGVELPLLMAKSRHASMKTLSLYAKPSFNAVATATARLDAAALRPRSDRR